MVANMHSDLFRTMLVDGTDEDDDDDSQGAILLGDVTVSLFLHTYRKMEFL